MQGDRSNYCGACLRYAQALDGARALTDLDTRASKHRDDLLVVEDNSNESMNTWRVEGDEEHEVARQLSPELFGTLPQLGPASRESLFFSCTTVVFAVAGL